ncbi:MAG: hypothetical protein AAGL17_12865, partial [Cyanobacteria bacterium J06576_12]
ESPNSMSGAHLLLAQQKQTPPGIPDEVKRCYSTLSEIRALESKMRLYSQAAINENALRGTSE